MKFLPKLKYFSFLLALLCYLLLPLYAYAINDENSKAFPYNIYYPKDVPLNQQILILTDFGPIVIVLNIQDAPKSTELFTKLIRSKYYDNTSFYRMYNNYFIQAGDPGESGIGNAGIKFPNESSYNLEFNEGTVALSNQNESPSTTGSQFFITFIKAPWLNGKYTIIGKVVSGIDILRSFFGKYDTNYRGIILTTIPFQIYILEDYIKSYPEYTKYFIASDLNKTSLLTKLLSDDNNKPEEPITSININPITMLDNLRFNIIKLN